jgi:hypothetical protein
MYAALWAGSAASEDIVQRQRRKTRQEETLRVAKRPRIHEWNKTL